MRVELGLRIHYGVGALLGYIDSMNSTKPFLKAKLCPAQLGLILLAVFVLMAALATGLPAQTNAPPAGPVNAQPLVGAPSNAIIGLPATGLPAGTPSNAIIRLPATGLPVGAPSNAIIGLPATGLPVGAPSSAIIRSPATGLPGGAPSSAIIGLPAAGLPGGAPAAAAVGRPSTNSAGASPARAATGISSASLKRITNSKGASGTLLTTNIPPRRLMPSTNKPALSTNRAVSANLRSPLIAKSPGAGAPPPAAAKAAPRKLIKTNIPPVLFLPWTNNPPLSTNRAAN